MSAKDKSASASRHGLTSGTAAAHSSVAQTLEASTQNDGQKEERKEDAEQLTAGKKPMATPDDTEAVGFVKSGSNVFKLRSGRRSHTRNVYVDEDGVTLHYKHPNKSKYFTWSGGHRKIPLEQVTEVLDDAEPDASVRRKKKSQNQDSTSRSSIVVGNKRKTLDFAPQSEKEKELWIRGLTTQVKSYRSAGFDEHQTMWLSQKFEEADVNGDESLDLKEIVKLMQSLSFCPLATEHVGELCKAQKLNKARFIELYKKLCRRAEIDNIFTKYATNCDYLSPDDLVKFFGQEQNEKLELTDAENLIQSAERCPEFKNRSLLSAAGFQDLFASERMNIMKPLCRKVYQDMTQPLSHYYINSSHNTYLEGNQLYGVSSVPQYERVLTHSCRCVELDVWDGSDGEPIVHHGYTLTSKVPFLDVLLGIKKSAFKNSDYPVILSLENHCSVEQQRIMAKYLHDTFGSSLVTESLEEGRDRLPSPEELRRKVIVECKKLPAVITDDDDSLSEEDEAAEMADEEVQQQVRKRAETEQRYQLATELSDCVTLQSSKFGSFEAAAAKRTFAFMTSFKENKALKLSESETVEFVRNNARLLSRIYPAGIRIGSCNFHPMPMWNVGCQVHNRRL
jgi:phosphatidylinositol phospholipase C delta